MTQLEGETLDVRLAAGALPVDAAIACAVQIADALDDSHRHGIIRRNLTPRSIILSSIGARLLDAGRTSQDARSKTALDDAVPMERTQAQYLKRDGSSNGPFRYMAPEQLEGKEPDVPSDIFALGAVLYEMTAGRPAFDGPNQAAVIAAVLDTDPPSLSRIRPGVPRELDHIVQRCLAKDPADRWQTARDLAAELRWVAETCASAVAGPAHEVGAGWKGNRLWPRTGLAAAILAAAAITIVLVEGGVDWERLRGWRESAHGTSIHSLAVLPLRNLSRDPDQDYFADGMTEELITDLSKLGTTGVIARGSIMQYKETRQPLPAVGRALKVDALVDGTVLRAGNRVRLTVALVDARTDRQMWADAFERDTRDLRALQTDVARSIATVVHGASGAEALRSTTTTRAAKPEAHELYLKGRYFLNKMTEDNVKRATEFFQRAVDLDADYALPHAGLADAAYYTSGAYLSPRDVMPMIRKEATKALDLDEALGEAHSALALVSMGFDFDWDQAERQFKRAIALNPNDALAHEWFGYYLALRERFDESVVELQRAHALDPLSPLIDLYSVILPDLYQRRYQQVVTELKALAVLHRDFYPIYAHMAIAYLQLGDVDAAVAELEHARQLDTTPWILGWLGHAYAKAGRTADARAVLRDLRERATHGYVQPYSLAIIHIALGEKDEAFTWLNKGYDLRDEQLTMLRIDPAFDLIRDDPRFQALMRRVHLSQ